MNQADHLTNVGRDSESNATIKTSTRITSYNVCYTKLLRIFAKAIDAYDFVLAPTLPMANYGAEMAGANEARPLV